jgi:hypothetical protein
MLELADTLREISLSLGTLKYHSPIQIAGSKELKSRWYQCLKDGRTPMP